MEGICYVFLGPGLDCDHGLTRCGISPPSLGEVGKVGEGEGVEMDEKVMGVCLWRLALFRDEFHDVEFRGIDRSRSFCDEELRGKVEEFIEVRPIFQCVSVVCLDGIGGIPPMVVDKLPAQEIAAE